jgi:hypothetical protein
MPGLLFILSLNSCSLLRKMGVAPESPTSTRSLPAEGIPKRSSAAAEPEKMPDIKDDAPSYMNFTLAAVDQVKAHQFRYSILLDVEVEKLGNAALYALIDDWIGTPYKVGGHTRRGVDCSGFVQNLIGAVYGSYMARTAREQRDQCSPIRKEELREGDLVFFNTRGGISHVGMYLHNDKFVHASTSNGVIISDLKETYWARRFVTAGRLSNSKP